MHAIDKSLINKTITKKNTKTYKTNQPKKTDALKTDPIKLMKEFFGTKQTLSGNFLHMISIKKNIQENNNQSKLAAPIILDAEQDYSGHFALDLSKPVKFKWKYIHPFIRQIVKTNKQLLYKEGQSKESTSDGVVVKKPNHKKPYVINQSLPLTFMFDIPVETWIDDIQITNSVEDNNYLKINCQYKNLHKKGFFKNMKMDSIELVFSKQPLCLIQWCFKDQNGHLNQITLFQISFDKKIDSYELD